MEIDLSKLQIGQMITPTWRRQVIYVVRRDQKMVDALPNNDSRLKDAKSEDSIQPPYAKNEMRSRRADLLVVIGICTHLGCLPKQFFDAGDPVLGADWPGGFRCPCHGSRFDLAGRVFQGSPASTNLVIPPYSFSDPNTLVVGLDGAPRLRRSRLSLLRTPRTNWCSVISGRLLKRTGTTEDPAPTDV